MDALLERKQFKVQTAKKLGNIKHFKNQFSNLFKKSFETEI